MKRDARDELPAISEAEYKGFSQFLKAESGIDLGQNKQYLVATRIRKILAEHQLPSLGALISKLENSSVRQLKQQVVDAMTTNETYWFRDGYPFDFLAKSLIPELSQRAEGGPIKIWSAACSSGQEPYSISMIFAEELKNKGFKKVLDADILATDVSWSVLESAKEACYDRISLVRGLTSDRIALYFNQLKEDSWQVKDAIRQRVRFRPVNLRESLFLLGRFDVVFCRNVLIYFNTELKLEIVRKIHSVLNPGGTLFLGASESITGLEDYFEMVYCRPGVAYRAKKL